VSVHEAGLKAPVTGGLDTSTFDFSRYLQKMVTKLGNGAVKIVFVQCAFAQRPLPFLRDSPNLRPARANCKQRAHYQCQP